MTRDKAINILARLAGGATQPSWDDIRKAAKFAYNVLSASKEDEVHIQFNDDRTLPKQQPQGLDEAAEKYAWEKEEPLADGERLSVCFNPRIDAFKAGVDHILHSGAIAEAEVAKLPEKAWITPDNPQRFQQDVFDKFTAGQKVLIAVIPNDIRTK